MAFLRIARFLVLLVLVFATEALGQAAKLDLTVGQWQEDLRFLAQELPKRHANAFHKSGVKILCKLVVWLPSPTRVQAEGKLVVKTMPDVMLTATNAKGQRIWTYNADHVPRWNAEHSAQLQRWSEDAKAGQQPVPAFAARRRAAV